MGSPDVIGSISSISEMDRARVIRSQLLWFYRYIMSYYIYEMI